MVRKCIECGKIIDSTRLYCKTCEEKIKKRIEDKNKIKEKIDKANFFEKQRYS
jgi:predicted amidophosphoribosyltransferase